MNITQILTSKKHNFHYLNRYINFIKYCNEVNQTLDNAEYVEAHHICPKSIDLFPEYTSFKSNPWNKCVVTARQHYIAHYLLFKAYGGRQTYAFNAMCNQTKNKNTQRFYKLNSKLYATVKSKISNPNHPNRGTSVYIDPITLKKVKLSTSDSRVTSGEFKHFRKGTTGTFTGRKHSEETLEKLRKPKSEEANRKNSEAHKGKQQSEESNKKRSDTLKGRIPWNKGLKKSIPKNIDNPLCFDDIPTEDCISASNS